MNNQDVKKRVGDTPHMSLSQADQLTAFMTEHPIENVLELGFAHGVSTCYMAAALDRMGRGHIVTIDIESALNLKPTIHELLASTGHSNRVTIYVEPTSYIWRLMRFLEEAPRPTFDLCYLDGAHSWFVDGFAFYLVDLLLKPGGWIIFDDLDWTYEQSPTLKDTEMVRNMPEDERTTPQVRKIYELLVKNHSQYHNFQIKNGWAYAQKKYDSPSAPCEREVVVEKVVQVQKEYVGIGGFLLTCGRKLLRQFKPKGKQ